MPAASPSSLLRHPSFFLHLLLILLLTAAVPCARSAILLSQLSLLVDVDEVASFGLSDVFSAYQLVQPNVTFTSTLQTTTQSTVDVSSATVDFAVVSNGLTTTEAATYPHLQLFPVLASALVAVYRLDALGTATLVLSRQALAAIYAGNVRWWDDPAIQSTNLATMPHQVIRVVFDYEPSDVSLIFSTALNHFQSGYPVAASTLPDWPTHLYLDWDIATGVTGVPAMVLNEDAAIGFAAQSNALAVDVSIASMINWANQTVAATSATITAAITEKTSGYSAIKRQTEQLDYTDGHGAMSWPIPILSNLLVDMTNSRATCHQRAALVEFWSWYYMSSVPATLLANRQYSPIPAFLQSQLDPVSALQTSLMCRGSPAVTVVSASSRTLSTSTGTQFLSTLLAEAYTSVDASVSWEAAVYDDELVMDQVINAETDIGFFIPGQHTPHHTTPSSRPEVPTRAHVSHHLSPMFCWLFRAEQRTSIRPAGSRWWSRTSISFCRPISCTRLDVSNNPHTAHRVVLESNGQVVLRPLTFQSPSEPLCLLIRYNPEITPSLTIPTNDLYLDIRTTTLIYFSCILWLNDSHLVDLNPTYATQLNTSNEMITQNVGCGSTPSQTPISYTILARMMNYVAAHPEDTELNNCVNNYPVPLYDDYYNCVSVPELNVFYAATETTVPPLVLGTPGAMGMMVVDGDSAYGVPTMVVERGGVNVSTTSDLASIAACAQGTFDASSLTFDTNNPVNVTCWPW